MQCPSGLCGMSGWEYHNVRFRILGWSACGSSLTVVLPRWRLWTEECPGVDDEYAPRLWYHQAGGSPLTQGFRFQSLKALQFQDGHLRETFVPALLSSSPHVH
jgi:hypothetical protein